MNLYTHVNQLSTTSQAIADEIIKLKRKNSSFTPFTQDQLALKFKVTREHINRCIRDISDSGLFTHYQPKKHSTQSWRRARYIMNPVLKDESIRIQLAPLLPSLHFYSLSRLMVYEPRLKKTVDMGNITRIKNKEEIRINNTTTDVVSRTCAYAREGDSPAVVSVVEQVLLFRLNKTIGEGMKPFTSEQMMKLQQEFSFEVIQKGEVALRKALFNGVVRDPFAYLWHSCKAIGAKQDSQQKEKSSLSPAARAMYGSKYTQEPPKREVTFQRTEVEEEAMVRLAERRKRLYSAPDQWQAETKREHETYFEKIARLRQNMIQEMSAAALAVRQKSLSKGMHKDYDKWEAEFPVPQCILEREREEDERKEPARNTSTPVYGQGVDDDQHTQRQSPVPRSHTPTHQRATTN